MGNCPSGPSTLGMNEGIIQFENKPKGRYIFHYVNIAPDTCNPILAIKEIETNPSYSITQNQSICKGDSINVDGTWISEAMSFVTEDQTASGCDSITTISITVDPIFDFTNSYSICEGDSIDTE